MLGSLNHVKIDHVNILGKIDVTHTSGCVSAVANNMLDGVTISDLIVWVEIKGTTCSMFGCEST